MLLINIHFSFWVTRQGTEPKYGIIFKTFFLSLISLIFEKNKTKQNKTKQKNATNPKFYDLLYYSSTFSLKFGPIRVSKNRNDKESMIHLTPKPNQEKKKNPKQSEFLYGFLQAQTLITINREGIEQIARRIYFEGMQIVSKAC